MYIKEFMVKRVDTFFFRLVRAERFTSEAAVDREEYSYEKSVEKTSLNLASVAAFVAPMTPLGGLVQAIGGFYGTTGVFASTTLLNATQASAFDYKDGKLSMELASVSKTKEYRGHTTETASESKVKTGGNLTINTNKELLTIGSSLESGGKLDLTSETGNVLMLSKELKQTSYEGEKKLEGVLS